MASGSIVEQPNEVRARLHGMWASVAEAWDAHADYVDARGAPVTERLLELTLPEPGERVLELACGPGSVGLAAAARVAPGGEVVLSDVVPEMTGIAAARVDALGLRNATTKLLDLERIEEPNESYDVVLCREGLMLVPDPARAARELRRVLRPGGRAALAVWGPRARNPWLAVVFEVVSAHLGTPVPPPRIPHPFSLDDPVELERLLLDAGFSDVVVDEVPVPYRAASFEEWWERSTALAGPLARKLASLPAPATQALRARARRAVREYETADGLDFPGVSLVAAARRV
jgi:enediyne biosynthesis protein CalE5